MLYGVVTGDVANLVCNECGVIVRTMPAAGLQRTMDKMESTLDVASLWFHPSLFAVERLLWPQQASKAYRVFDAEYSSE